MTIAILLALAAAPLAADPKPVVRIAVPVIAIPAELKAVSRGALRAIRLALEEVNATGTLPFRVEAAPFEERLGNPAAIAGVAERMAADPGVAAVIGHSTSGSSLAAGRVYARHRLAMVSIFSPANRLTEAQLAPDWPGPPNCFRLIPSDGERLRRLADFASRKRGFGRVAILYDALAWPDGVLPHRVQADTLRERLSVNGATVTAVGPFSDAGPATAGSPDAAFLLSSELQNAVRAAKALRGRGFRGALLLGDAPLDSTVFGSGPALDGAFIAASRPRPRDLPGGAAFAAKLKKRYPGAPVFDSDPFAYEAAYVILAALAQLGPTPRREEVIRKLAAVRFEGVLGLTTFDRKGDTLNRRVTTIVQVNRRERTFTPVE